jgi:hypothetical protein
MKAHLAAWPVEGPSAAGELSRTLPGHWKLKSWLALHQLGLPTLPGIVVFVDEPASWDAVDLFMARRGYDEMLVRSDRVEEVGKYPRGGFVVGGQELKDAVASFLRAQRTVYLLEPIDPLRDQYSVNVAEWPAAPTLEFEVVGRGFDASDLKRGDLSPHESLALLREPVVPTKDAVVERTEVTAERYARSRAERIAKLTANPQTPRQFDIVDAIIPTTYSPIPLQLIAQLRYDTALLAAQLPRLDLPGAPFVLSASFIDDDLRPVYWDVVWPHLKFRGAVK